MPPLFTPGEYRINDIISKIRNGEIGLPELQRPFEWSNKQVRDLLDSLYKGYPTGYLLFWKTGVMAGIKGIGAKNTKAAPELAVIDGQQRLTALYASIVGEEVVRKNFKKERIRIAFNPSTERFEDWSDTPNKNKLFIPDISQIWEPDIDIFSLANDFLNNLPTSKNLSDLEKKKIRNSIGKLNNLINQYSFTVLTLNSSVSNEDAANIFVRINSKGTRLNQSNFIMTLMSVYWDEGRTELETFAHMATQPSSSQNSPFNHFIKPSPTEMLRVTTGLALKRARFASVYNALHRQNAIPKDDNRKKRSEQLREMQDGQNTALNLTNWHHFLSAMTHAGYRSEKMISSNNAIIYSYVLYLIGIKDYGIAKRTMKQSIAEFFFMSALTGRYSGTSEGQFEADLGIAKELADGESYLTELRKICTNTLTQDFWNITLPTSLTSSSSKSPTLFAYHASLIKLNADVLYNQTKIAELVDPAIKAPKVALERHHLFPKRYLNDQGLRDTKKINQIANYALIEWPDNISIGNRPPSKYAPPLDKTLTTEKRKQHYFWHALPNLWWELPYEEFLEQRRKLIAQVIKHAWETLTGTLPKPAKQVGSAGDLINLGESDTIEFKSTLRINLHTGKKDDKIQFAVLKTIAAFLNTGGGTLLIGVADSGKVRGLEADGFQSEDKMERHLTSLIGSNLSKKFLPYIHPKFEYIDGKRIMTVRCDPGPHEAFLKDGERQYFFVRGGNATTELQGTDITDYVHQRFKKTP